MLAMSEFAQIALRAFLAVVFVASALAKLRRNWPAQVVAYGLWTPGWAVAAARWLTAGEFLVAVMLVAAPVAGLVAAGSSLVLFGHVQWLALRHRYDGGCGCSATGRVSRAAVARAYGWGVIALSVGWIAASIPAPLAVALTSAAVTLDAVALWTSVLLWPGPRAGARGSA